MGFKSKNKCLLSEIQSRFEIEEEMMQTGQEETKWHGRRNRCNAELVTEVWGGEEQTVPRGPPWERGPANPTV